MHVIYKLTFESGDTYVGKTGNYDKRMREHINSQGKGSPKLQHAFATSTLINKEVLASCSADGVNELEVKYISQLSPTLNTLPGGEGMSGLNHPRCVYTKEQILNVVELLKTDLPGSTIASQIGVPISLVMEVSIGKIHAWATENVDLSHRRTGGPVTVFSPSGVPHTILDNYYLFEQANGLSQYAISRLKLGSIKEHKGWSVHKPTMYIITSPEGDSMQVTKFQAKEVLSPLMSRVSLNLIMNKAKKVKGWTLKEV